MKVWKPAAGELEKLKVKSWGIWEKEVSTFDWSYDEQETCYIIAGQASVTSQDGKLKIEFKAGDLVQFPPGLSCIWEVIQPIKKHYKFGKV